MTESHQKVALFPIPNVVAFPGTTIPLHVFEPRYRTMISDCVEQERMIAVSHTTKEIRPAKSGQTMQDALKSNQATYETAPVFTAGQCELIETTSDGRVYINIHMTTRLKKVGEVQTLPYRIVSCEEVIDDEEPLDATNSLQRQITSRILNLIGQQSPAQLAQFDSDHWLNMPASDFSFQLFQMLRFDSDTMQSILECTHASKRLEIIQSTLQLGSE
ncbi:MAG: Lon protease-like protein [Candidatus Azotimanducaceae bacterium]|jgi:Lon protease-like protein